MKLEDFTAYTEKCFSGGPPPCTNACPLRLDVRSIMGRAENGKWNAAYKLLRNAVVFPRIVSALCPGACRGRCRRVETGSEPIAARLIEDACVRFAKNQKPDNYAIPPKKERIAIVGAGTAGLSAALCLAQKKFQVTVFDKNSGWGGSLRTHPQFEEFDADLNLQFSFAGAQFIFEKEITSLDGLAEFDMVYIATGADGEDYGLLPGWDSKILSTCEQRVFLGGSLAGADMVSGIAQGKSLSIIADYFLQTGRADAAIGDVGKAGGCGFGATFAGRPPAPLVVPADSSGYSEEEAKSEAARCMKCDCDMCMTSCEMLGMYRKKPKKIAMEAFADTNVNPPISTHTLTRQAYSCSMCGHCREVCPADVDIGPVLRLSREARAGDEAYPEALHDYWLREMDFSAGEASFYAPPKSGKACRYVFYPGCQLGAHNPEHVTASYELLNKTYDTGIYLGCCGAPAYWAGDIKRQKDNFEKIRKVWLELDKAEFVFACATCESVFNAFLPEIPGISIYELMTRSDGLSLRRVFGSASVFDPCNARGNNGMEEAVRELARKSGTEVHDLPEKNRCCGYGGHIRLANPGLYGMITENRAAMGDDPYIVYCANCREVFLSRGKDCAHILDIALGLPGRPALPKIDEKRDNAIKVKTRIMKETTGVGFSPAMRDWDGIDIIVSDALGTEIENKLISQSDIKEAIWRAEDTGDKFIDGSGVFRCSLQKPVLTYWVAYKKAAGEAYEVVEAYSHRMKFRSC